MGKRTRRSTSETPNKKQHKNNANTALADTNKLYPLHEAIAQNHLREVIRLLQEGFQNTKNTQDVTPLMTAVQHKRYEALTEMLTLPSYRKDLKTQDQNGDTLLHQVLMSSKLYDLNIALLLIRNGAPNVANQNGIKPWSIVVVNKVFALMDAMLQHMSLTPADINMKNEHGDSVLHTALLYISQDNDYTLSNAVAKTLIEKGALTTPNNEKVTPLMAAIRYQKFPIVALLLKTFNINEINLTDDKGNTLLHYAAASQNIDLIKHLLDNGAKSTKNTNGSEPVVFCIHNMEAISMFLDYKQVLNINSKDCDHHTILHTFAETNDMLKIQKAVDMGAKNTLNMLRETPFGIAIKHRHQEIIDFFLKEGLVTNIYGTTLQNAVDTNNMTLIKTLLMLGGSYSGTVLDKNNAITLLSTFHHYYLDSYYKESNRDAIKILVYNNTMLQTFLSRQMMSNDLLVKIFDADMDVFFANCKKVLPPEQYYTYMNIVARDCDTPVRIRKSAMKSVINSAIDDGMLNTTVIAKHISDAQLLQDFTNNKEAFFNALDMKFSFLKACYTCSTKEESLSSNINNEINTQSVQHDNANTTNTQSVQHDNTNVTNTQSVQHDNANTTNTQSVQHDNTNVTNTPNVQHDNTGTTSAKSTNNTISNVSKETQRFIDDIKKKISKAPSDTKVLELYNINGNKIAIPQNHYNHDWFIKILAGRASLFSQEQTQWFIDDIKKKISQAPSDTKVLELYNINSTKLAIPQHHYNNDGFIKMLARQANRLTQEQNTSDNNSISTNTSVVQDDLSSNSNAKESTISASSNVSEQTQWFIDDIKQKISQAPSDTKVLELYNINSTKLAIPQHHYNNDGFIKMLARQANRLTQEQNTSDNNSISTNTSMVQEDLLSNSNVKESTISASSNVSEQTQWFIDDIKQKISQAPSDTKVLELYNINNTKISIPQNHYNSNVFIKALAERANRLIQEQDVIDNNVSNDISIIQDDSTISNHEQEEKESDRELLELCEYFEV